MRASSSYLGGWRPPGPQSRRAKLAKLLEQSVEGVTGHSSLEVNHQAALRISDEV